MQVARLIAMALVGCVACARRPETRGAPMVERTELRAGSRLLVIHADDFGMSHSVNRATIQAFENRWITSASILVPCPWFPEVVKFAREHPDADLGIHLALNSEWTSLRWGPVAPRDRVPSLLDADGYLPLVETQVVERARASEVEIELLAQVDKARRAGISITHFDAHMGTLLRSPDLFSTFLKISRSYHMPVRVAEPPEFARGTLLVPRWIDGLLGLDPSAPADRWLESYEKALAPLPPGSYQLTVHLGFDDEEMRGATYDHPNWGAAWRQRDFDVVRSAAFRQFLKDQRFTLVGWRDLAEHRPAAAASD
jgi:predicted glycoside hydrolase/deacetylase ChbG (UPF0249 family)